MTRPVRSRREIDAKPMRLGRAAVRALVAALVVWLAALPAYAQSVPPTALASRVGGDGERTRFVLDIDRPVAFKVFALADPYRVIVDLPEVNFQLPATDGKQGRGLVSAYRYGLFAIDKSRIVLDMAGPVFIEKSFILPAQDGQPARLVVDFVRTDRDTFLRQLALARQPGGGAEAAPPEEPPPPVRAPGSAPVRRNNKLIVVIDPGHGGVDPGTIARNGTKEKHVVLALGKVLARSLERTGRYVPVMTRSTDVFLPLRRRVALARENGASLFISLHADSFRSSRARGATVYTLSERASDAEAAALARGENRSDVIAGINLAEEPDEVAGILIDLAQRESKNFSVRFAQDAIGAMRGQIRLNTNPHRFAGFRVLKAPDVPSVLIEIGYLSNRSDARELGSSAWRERMAAALTRAVDTFFQRRFALSRQ
jgi:N-acetylmuramoyl-L-alanine amidase